MERIRWGNRPFSLSSSCPGFRGQIRSHRSVSSSGRASSIPLKSNRETLPTTFSQSTIGTWRERRFSISRNASIAVLPGGILWGSRIMTSASSVLAALFPSASTRRTASRRVRSLKIDGYCPRSPGRHRCGGRAGIGTRLLPSRLVEAWPDPTEYRTLWSVDALIAFDRQAVAVFAQSEDLQPGRKRRLSRRK
jgi:hypothetical protein